MTSSLRDQMLLETLTVVADTLVDDFDVVDLLHDLVDRCSALFDAVDVGIVLSDSQHRLVVMAATNERSRLIEVLQLAAGHGPCLDAYRTGEVVTAGSIDEIAARWPSILGAARDSGYQSVHAIPLRLRRTTIGSLNLFRDTAGHLDPRDVQAAKTIADVTTIGLVQERAIKEASDTRDQLQHALTARILIEQAKGIIAHSQGVDMETAWALLRQRARSRQARVTDIAQAVVDGLITV
jgi:transcriptional regulator with GAF, ATPase, and Fis domain